MSTSWWVLIAISALILLAVVVEVVWHLREERLERRRTERGR
jgi:hypothetical protein